jgi:protocatechuate 3,4-dioxygenase beta subunit
LNVAFCTGNDTDALAAKWLRGFQTTGADGRAQFDGIFPGWYKSRTPHVHFIVSVNGKKFISQFVFDDTTDTVVGRGGLTAEMAIAHARSVRTK